MAKIKKEKLTRIGKSFVCEECNINFERKHNYKRHLANIHGIVNGVPSNSKTQFVCEVCGKSYGRSDHLAQHALLHKPFREKYYECNDCDKKYWYKYPLKCHIMKVHLKIMKPKQESKDVVYTCEFCHLNFKYRSTRNFHTRRFHLPVEKQGLYECANCDKKYLKKHSLASHIVNNHLKKDKKRVVRPSLTNPFLCVLCQQNCPDEKSILDHFRSTHELIIEEENHHFKTKEDFKTWITTKEKEMFGSFISGHNKNTYHCHRSGFYAVATNRKRRAPSKGSKKINGYCPSRILYNLNKDGSYDVHFIKTHVGHSATPDELVYVRLSAQKKNEIVGKIASGIPLKEIMENLREKCEISENCLDKDLLLTRKDVRNVALNLNRSQHVICKDEDDILDVESYVRKNEDSILFYKRQGESNAEHSYLRQEDFLLIVMKQQQFQYLMGYGFNVIVLNSNQGKSSHDFLLHTMLVSDQNNEGYPCCFCITNRHDLIPIDIMLKCVKKKCGKIETRCLMAGLQETHFNLWSQVMDNIPQFKLFSSWRIKRTWHFNLKRIETKEKKDLVKNILQDLCNESSVDEFHKKLFSFLNIDDEDLLNFINYFRKHFQNNAEQWAYCYRQRANIPNISVDRFDRIIFPYTRRFGVEEIKDCLHVLDSFIEGKCDENPIVSVKKQKSNNKMRANLNKINIEEEDDQCIVEAYSDEHATYIITGNEKPACNFYETASKIICDGDNVSASQLWCSSQENRKSNMYEHGVVDSKNLMEVVEVDENYEDYVEETISQNLECDSESDCIKEIETEFNDLMLFVDSEQKAEYVLTMLNQMKRTLSTME